jgi:hypothetical protein
LLFSIPPSDAPGPCMRARETVKLLSFPCISFSESSLFNGLRQISRVPSPGRLAPPPPGHVPRLKAGVGSKSSQRNATHQGVVSDFRHKFFSWPFPSGRPPRAAPRPIVCMRPQAERVRWRRTLGFLLQDGGGEQIWNMYSTFARDCWFFSRVNYAVRPHSATSASIVAVARLMCRGMRPRVRF